MTQGKAGASGRGGKGRGARPARGRPARPAAQRKPQPAKKNTRASEPVRAPREAPRTFRLGAIPGATPGKWIDTWKQRMPHVTLELVPITLAQQREALNDLDAAIVRLPVQRASDLHTIALYDEIAVVVTNADSPLLDLEEIDAELLAGEVYVRPADTVYPDFTPAATEQPRFAPPEFTEDAIATVATGIGFTVVPLSLARAHRRKDAGHRPLVNGPSTSVALAWLREHTTPDVDAFVGVVRGRTAQSSR